MNQQQQMDTQEMISALADGQLRGEAFARGVQAAATDPAGRQAWHAYHLIGDVLRSGELARGSDPQAFLARLSQRLAQEPPLAAPAIAPDLIAADVDGKRAAGRFTSETAANDGAFRWKLVAGVASVAAVAALAWTVVDAPGGAGTSGQPQLATATQQQPGGMVLAGSQQGPMLRDPELDELMAAHRQFGNATALQTPAGFLRNATFEGPGR